jgi:uncharacterized protein YcsI (UPF0317 family)
VRAKRPRAARPIRAVQITTRFPAVHGAPVHIGKPELIGIADPMNPDYGDAVPVNDDELPAFLGLRRDAAIGDCDSEAGVLHHGLPRQHAGERTERILKFAIMCA